MMIGFIGFKQVGKSTACAHLEQKYGFTRHSFKKALVDEINLGFPDLLQEIVHAEMARKTMLIDDEESIEDAVARLFEEKPPLMRMLLQNFGTEIRRGDNKNYWVRKWRETLPEGNVSVDDVRFLNEAQTLTANGGVLVRLTRPDVQGGDGHSSEMEQLEITPEFTIECEQGDHEKLYKELDEVYRQISS